VSNPKKPIDIENVLRTKNSKLHSILPQFLLNKLKHIIHEDEINAFLIANSEKQGHDFVAATLAHFKTTVRVVGTENIPSSGPAIVAANHPLGGLDALALIHALSKRGKRNDVVFIVNDILLQLTNLKNLFVGVNKHGKTATEMLSAVESAYASEKLTLVFPAGLVSRKQGKEIKDLEWKKSFITQAKKNKRDIVPVFIDAKNSNWFYNLALWRKRLGINANIEMLYLVDEMYKQKNKPITITFGKPLAYSTFDKSYTDAEWAQKLKEHIYTLQHKATDTNAITL
jgi:1-acyl-sn-glycerol-3-phosphate acyltransferase